MLTLLVEVPQLQGLIPFVRWVYASPTTCAWKTWCSSGGGFNTREEGRGPTHASPLQFGTAQFSLRSQATHVVRRVPLRLPG